MTTPSTDALVEEFAARWRTRGPVLVEEFLAPSPTHLQDRETALDLIAEELALRAESRQPISLDELTARFPQWSNAVRAIWECHRLLSPQFPASGDTLGEFQLHEELGRGAHGRVYLATQSQLAERPVVLKVSPDSGGEHLSLARLQHSNIVPLFSVHEFPEQGLRALCLPYFGGVTLNAIRECTSGVDVLERLGNPASARSPACAFLSQATWSEFLCWLGASLADALQYAHDRELLHLDVKPSNVLIASDGVPMLLDFHLAHPPIAAGSEAPRWLGGTPGFMAPEVEAALPAVRERSTIAVGIDGRADVYSLGRTLKELLAGHPEASPGLTDILAKATANEPSERYDTSAAFASDLRRQVADLPLKGVTNRSLAERWRKWRRRRPYALPMWLTLIALTLGLGSTARYALRWNARAIEKREVQPTMANVVQPVENEHLDRGRKLFEAQRYEEAIREFHAALVDDPRSISAHQYLGLSYLKLKQPHEALAACSACVALSPNRAASYYNRGLAFAELHRLDAALADFDRAIALDAKLPAAWFGRAIVHHKRGEKAKAIDDLNACLLHDPSHREAREWLTKLQPPDAP